jgi:taurine dioxygenase
MNTVSLTQLAEAKLRLVELRPHIGTEVCGLDLSKPLEAATIAALRTVWLDRALLVFRGQKLTQEDLVRFTRYFGEVGERGRSVDVYPSGLGRVLPEIMLISNIRENGKPIGALPDGELSFHHDMIQTAVPHMASVLYSVEVPSSGGDTCFAAGHAAYDTLDPKIKTGLEGKRVFNHYQYGTTRRGDKSGGFDAIDQSLHPAFRTHEETGRKAIYVNRLMSMKVEGLDDRESEALLNAVFDHAEKAEFVYRHQWKVGDLLIWDNRNSMHARTDFPSEQRRLLWRTQVRGTHRPY